MGRYSAVKCPFACKTTWSSAMLHKSLQGTALRHNLSCHLQEKKDNKGCAQVAVPGKRSIVKNPTFLTCLASCPSMSTYLLFQFHSLYAKVICASNKGPERIGMDVSRTSPSLHVSPSAVILIFISLHL